MIPIENKIVSFIQKKKDFLFFSAITLLSLMIRYCMINVMSGDMENSLLVWYKMLSEWGGFKGLRWQVGDYNIFYQTVIAFLTYLPVEPMIAIKAFSVIFDFLIAFFVARFCSVWEKGKLFDTSFNTRYALVLIMPTVLLNSAAWGQCDAVYAFMVIMSFYFMYEAKYFWAFLFWGLAVAFKLQAIFILPFYITVYFYRKNFSCLWFLFSVIVFWLSGVPGFIQGRRLFAPFRIYLNQTNTYPEMFLNFPSFWSLIGNQYDTFKNVAIITVVILCGVLFYLVISGKKEIDTHLSFLNTAICFVWTVVIFLPGMHERYAYALEILLLFACFLDRKYFPYCAGMFLLSTITYSSYLFYFRDVPAICTVSVHIFLYCLFIYNAVIDYSFKKECSAAMQTETILPAEQNRQK